MSVYYRHQTTHKLKFNSFLERQKKTVAFFLFFFTTTQHFLKIQTIYLYKGKLFVFFFKKLYIIYNNKLNNKIKNMSEVKQFAEALEDWFLSEDEIMDTIPSADEIK